MATLTALLSYVLEVNEPEPMATLLNESVLFVSDSLGTYQTKFLTVPTTGLTLTLLLGEEDYPRSLRYLLERLENVLNKLKPPAKRPHPRDRIPPMREELARFVTELNPETGTTDQSRKAALDFLASCRRQLKELSDYITTSYFSHAGNQG